MTHASALLVRMLARSASNGTQPVAMAGGTMAKFVAEAVRPFFSEALAATAFFLETRVVYFLPGVRFSSRSLSSRFASWSSVDENVQMLSTVEGVVILSIA